MPGWPVFSAPRAMGVRRVRGAGGDVMQVRCAEVAARIHERGVLVDDLAISGRADHRDLDNCGLTCHGPEAEAAGRAAWPLGDWPIQSLSSWTSYTGHFETVGWSSTNPSTGRMARASR